MTTPLSDQDLDLLNRLLTRLEDQRGHRIDQLADSIKVDAARVEHVLRWFQHIESDLSIKAEGEVCWQPSDQLLNVAEIQTALAPDVHARLAAIDTRYVCTSTNNLIKALPNPEASMFTAALGEYQSNGVGRHGRRWLSPFASGVCLTVAVNVGKASAVGSALSLAIGVGVASSLEKFSPHQVLLKWPNDLILDEGKLGGILVAAQPANDGEQILIIGVGINIERSVTDNAVSEPHALPVRSLKQEPRAAIDRNRLTAKLVSEIVRATTLFQSDGFSAFQSKWLERDYLAHQPVQIFEGEHIRHGVAKGVNEAGALLVEVDGQLEELHSGEVRVRTR